MRILSKPKWLAALAVLMIVGAMPPLGGGGTGLAAACEGTVPGTTPDCPIIIVDAAGLNRMRNNLEAHYALGADIDLSAYLSETGDGYNDGNGWVPVGSGGVASFAFRGTFDGNGHTISNLKMINNSANIGLFGVAMYATIQNVGLINVDIKVTTGGDSAAGGLVGTLDTSTIQNVYVTGRIDGLDKAGGLAGHLYGANSRHTELINSYSSATVTGANAGGVVGYTEGIYYQVRSTYYNQSLTPGSALGAGLTTEQMKSSGNFGSWDFSGEGQWGIIEGVTFPMHRTTFNRIGLDRLTIEGDVSAIEPALADDRFMYSSRVTGDVERVTVAAEARSDSSSIAIKGEVTDSKLIELVPGENAVDITVSTADIAVPGAASDPFEVTYTLLVIRENGADYPHRISTEAQLASIGTGPYRLGDKYELMNDLDLTGLSWNPIGSEAAPFTGVFEGNGHVIRNLSVNASGDNAGLFAVSSGMIANLGVEHAAVSGVNRVGGLIGDNAGTVRDVYVKGSVTGSSDVGGLIGLTSGAANVENAYFAGSATGSEHVGGLIGRHVSGAVSSSYWDAEIDGLIDSAGGEGKTTEEMQRDSTYVGWDFTNTWAMMNGATYPMFNRHFDAVKLNSLSVAAAGADLDWEPANFDSRQGAYQLVADRYIESVDIAAAVDDTNSTLVTIAGTASASATVPVKAGDNVIVIETSGGNGAPRGQYKLVVRIPAPEMTGVDVPPAGLYGLGAPLSFVVSYEGRVDVSGVPTIPLAVGDGTASATVYAAYTGQPDGEPNKLIFTYPVQEGLEDSDGIEIGAAIELPDGAAVTAAGTDVAVSLALPPIHAGGVFIDSRKPHVTLTQQPASDVLTREPVTVTAVVYGTGSPVAVVKWAEGLRTEPDFATGGEWLTGGSFTATANGTYSVYAEDAAGNSIVVTIDIGNIVTASPHISLSYSPIAVTNGPVVVGVAAEAQGDDNTLARLNWMPGSRSAAEFADGANGADILNDMNFTVTTNGIYTVYAKDRLGNEAVKAIAINHIVTTLPQIELNVSPVTSTAGPVTVHVNAVVTGDGNTLARLNWMPGSRSAADFAEGANGADMLAAKQFAAATNGIYTVYAQDAAGNEAVKEIAISNIVTASSPGSDHDSGNDSGSSLNNPPTPSSDTKIVKHPDGGISIRIDRADIVKETLEDGSVVEHVALTNDIIERVLALLEEGETLFATVEIDDSGQAVQVRFPAASLETVSAADPDAVFKVELNGASFQLPVSVLDLEGWAERLDVGPQHMLVNVVIGQVTGQAKAFLEHLADSRGLKPIGPVVDFRVTVTAEGRTMEAHDFGGAYIVRAIVPDEERTARHVTAVLYDPANLTLTFVPAVMTTRNDGQREMSMKVPHNSMYAIMEAEHRSFSDMNGHWAAKEVELLASKLIVNGVSAARFAPDDTITRAEFTALLVRALALRTGDPAGKIAFADVSADDWHAPAIAAGVEAGLVNGISRDRFAPDAEITREQMAVMFANALRLAGVPALDEDRVSELLDTYADRADISAWAESAVAQSAAAGIMLGVADNELAPSGLATRAQAAVMLKRFLQYVAFID